MARDEAGVLPMKACPLPSLVRRPEADPDPACVLTMRAADKWDAARFKDIFPALGFFHIPSRVSSHPLAANAGRWATGQFDLPPFNIHFLLSFSIPTHVCTNPGNLSTISVPNKTSSMYPICSMSTILHKYDLPHSHQV